MTETLQAINALGSSINAYNEEFPHVLSYELLAMGSDESEPLSKAAASRWKRILDGQPEDAVAAHHLAVICHGLAFQLHSGSDPEQLEAIEYWQRALKIWGKVISNENFWKHLTETWTARVEKGKGDMLAERLTKIDLQSVRKRLPQYLLDIHTRIILTAFGKNTELANQHLGLIRSSPFSDEYKKRATESIYQSSVGGSIETLLSELRSDEALKLLRDFLVMDPDHSVALVDALRASSKESVRLKSTGAMFSTRKYAFTSALSWAKRLEEINKNANDMFIPDAIRTFYKDFAEMEFLEGVDLANKKSFVTSTDHFISCVDPALKAMQLEKGGQAARKLYINICNHVGMLAVVADHRTSMACEIVEKSLKHCPDSPMLHARMAYISSSRGDKSRFDMELKEAQKCQQANPDNSAAQLIGELQNGGMGIAMIPLINSANEAMGNKDYYSARQKLNKVVSADSDNALAYVLLSLCHNHEHDLVQFRSVFAQAKAANKRRKDPQATELIKTIERQL